MYQIDNSTAATTQPASTAAGSPGFFTDGNAATGVPATVLPAEFMNSVMLELLGVLKAAGITPTKSRFDQLATAIQTIVQQGALSFAVDKSTTPNILTAAVSPAPSALSAGMTLYVLVANSINTGSTTLSLNGQAAVPVTRPDGTSLITGDLVAGQIAALRYDGQRWQCGIDIPAPASESVAGVAKIAAQDMVNAGADNSMFVTPKKLISWFGSVMKQATETTLGWAKIAGQGDVNNGTDDTMFVTSKKLSVWFSNIMQQATESTFGWAKIAAQDTVNAGADNTMIVTPKKLVAWFGSVMKQATESAFGWSKIASQDQIYAGTDDTAYVTPFKLRLGFSALFNASGGYFRMPGWLGGLTFQWGKVTKSGGGTSYTFPVGFGEVYGIQTREDAASTNNVELLQAYQLTTTGFVAAGCYYSSSGWTSSDIPGWYFAYGK